MDKKGKPDALLVANKKLQFQYEEKRKRAAELVIANKELVFQNKEKGKRAAELIVANKELVFQNKEKGKRAAELIVANKELVFQNKEKGKRAAELIIANKELAFQGKEKGKRAAELIIANKELAYQNKEKGKRAAELVIANKELLFQNEEKEKRAAELTAANKELLAFNYISSHDLQEPLRKIKIFANMILEKDNDNLSISGKDYFHRIQASASRMQQLIDDLLAYSRLNLVERKFEKTDLNSIIDEIKEDLQDSLDENSAIVDSSLLCAASIIPFQFRQMMYNFITNSLKFAIAGIPPRIKITGKIIARAGVPKSSTRLLAKKYCHIRVKDNGIGFSPEYNERIFDVFQKLHSKEEYAGTGIGLAIVKKIVENHNGIIIATGELSKGATFDIYIPEP